MKNLLITSLVSFGKHHPEIFDEINMNEVVKTTYDGMIQLIEHLYFNDYRPQYQNIKMKNMQQKLCEFYDGTTWKTIDESTLIHNIIVYTKDIIDNHFIKNIHDTLIRSVVHIGLSLRWQQRLQAIWL